ncbi:MAG: sulfotransferase [Maricaulaceae bacterium]|jgi:tetratricopeptide (TPR) repeat protein
MVDPDQLSTALDEAERLLAARRYREAHALCIDVLKRDPQRGRAFELLGMLTADHGNVAKALELFDRALAAGPESARAHAHRAKALTALTRAPEARAAAERAAAVDPRDAHTLDTIGVVFTRTGDHARAVDFFRRATQIDPRQANYFYNLGAAEEFLGDFAAAETALRQSIKLDPANHRAYSSLVALKRQTDEENEASALKRLFAEKSEDPEAALHIGHALAKTYEDLGEPERALEWLNKAKAAKWASLNYDPATDQALFEAAKRTLDGPKDESGWASAAPIFIVGLPRTGTTLVDRILSSHPEVASAGELTDFALHLKRAAGTPSPYVLDAPTLDAARTLDLTPIGQAYEQSARRVVGNVLRFIDKMPLNFFYAALIRRALPNARIIRLKRDPMDAGLSNYRQLFATTFTYYSYAYDLEATGRYVLAFEDLMTHWRAHLPPERYTEVAYEDIVEDLERETRRLLAFCDLPWDERCLRFYENDSPVATASSVQVRSPIHARSIGRWRQYGEGIEPLKRVIEAGLETS